MTAKYYCDNCEKEFNFKNNYKITVFFNDEKHKVFLCKECGKKATKDLINKVIKR